MFISARASIMFKSGVTAKTGRKFRYKRTDSVKAQRSAEEKRKMLDEKLQLDWAWMPMAAMMNQNSTNQVYWTPPVYDSNVVAAITKSAAKVPRYRSRKKKLSSSRRRAKLIADGSFIAEDAIATVESIAAECISTTDDSIKDYDRITNDNNVTKHMDSITQSGETVPKYGSSKKKKLSSSRRRSKTADDDSIPDSTISDDSIPDYGIPDGCIPDDSILDAIKLTTHSSVTTPQHRSTMKKKLSSSRRRAKLTAEGITIEEVKEEDKTTEREADSNMYSTRNWENDLSTVIKDSNENVKHAKTLEKQHDNESIVNSHAMESDSYSIKHIKNTDREINIHNNLINNTPIIGQCYQCNSNKPRNLTRSTTLLKLMEKFSNLNILPEIMQTKKKDSGLRKVVNEPKQTSNMKIKRPSIKVYQGYTKRPSIRSTPSIRSSNKVLNQETLYRKTESLFPDKSIIERVNSNESQSDKADSGIFEESDIDSEDTILNVGNLSNVQLKTMLSNLDKYYEEKLNNRDTEIEHLRTSVQTQEKLIMQLVHVTMGIKSDFDRLRKNNKFGNEIMEINEKLSNCEHLDNEQLSNNNPSNDVIISQKTNIESKANVVTIQIREN